MSSNFFKFFNIFANLGKTVVMSKFINDLKKIFLYTPSATSYDFSLPETYLPQTDNGTPEDVSNLPIVTSLDENLTHLKVKYNALINSDIILREFTLNLNGTSYKSLIVCIDGMINSELVNNFLLRPLMESSNSSTKTISRNGIKIKKSKKIDLATYISNSLVPQNDINKVNNLDDLIDSVNSGDCALLVDTLDVAFIVDVKGYKAREISAPTNEIVIRGSQEAFVEKLRTNTSMLRRIINSENLIIEDCTVGKISKTNIAICYLKNIANSDLVNEVIYRINNLAIDYVISSGQLEQLIQDKSNVAFPQLIATERSDKASLHILEGRVVVIVDGSPYVLIMPGVFLDFLSSPEDINLKHQYSNLLKLIRFLATFITLLLPGIYVAVSNYHTELLPTELLFTIAASRNTVPFPSIVEIFIMEVSFELLREAGLRVPTPFGSTIGIIGTLVLGESAVSANLVSPILIIIVAITGICSFTIPDFSLSFSFRIFRFLYIVLGYLCGLLGIAMGIFIHLAILVNLKSFGAPYLAPYVPATNLNASLSYFIKPIWARETRADFLNTKRPKQEEKFSRKWKFWERM